MNKMYNELYADEKCVGEEVPVEPTFTDHICTTHDLLMKSLMLVTEISGRLFGGDSPVEQGKTRSTVCMYDDVEDNRWIAKNILQTLDYIQRRLG